MTTSEMTDAEIQAAADQSRREAVSRLMTVMPHSTPEERRIYAEWIVDAILSASTVRSLKALADGAGR